MTNLGRELAFEFPALPERVWDALTNRAKIAAWFAENDFVPEVGRPFTLRPLAASGVDGPIQGDIVVIEPPSRLVMRWRLATGDVVMTWRVEPGRGGSLLRVVQTGILGPGRIEDASFIGAEAIYRRLFDERLRAFLRGGMLGKLTPAAQPPGKPLLPAPGGSAPPGSHPTPSRSTTPRSHPSPSPYGTPPPAATAPPVGRPASDGSTGHSGVSSVVSSFPAVTPSVTPPGGMPPTPTRRRRGRSWTPTLAIGIGVVVALAIGGWALASAGSPISWGAPGPQGAELTSGPVPGSGDISPPPGGATGPGGPGGPGGPPPGGSPPPGSGPSPGASVGVTATVTLPPPLPLQASYITLNPGLLDYTVSVSVTNPAGVDQTWRNVTVAFEGLNLMVSNVDGSVLYRASGATACFAPTGPAALIPAGVTFTFQFKVVALVQELLSDVKTVSMNQAVCDL